MKRRTMNKRNTMAFWALLCLSLASIGTAIAIPTCPPEQHGTSLTASCCYEPGSSACISESKDSNGKWHILQDIPSGSACDDNMCL